MGVIIGNVIAIYRKELQSYFASPFAYVIAGIFWLLSGILFVRILLGVIAEATFRDQMGMALSIDVPYEVLVGFLGWLAVIALFLLPMLSMGLYTEERKRGTLELLATSPVTNWAVALGKLLGVLTFVITMALPLLVYEAIAFSAADPPMSISLLLVGHLGFILMAAAILSLGMFVSTLTDSTVLAAILTFALIALLVILNWLAGTVPGPVGDALNHLSLLRHYGNLVQGVIDTSSLALFASYILLGLFLTAQSIEVFRYQRS
ncbi:MAG: ABC transporter permease [Synechococcales bacterium]|nr:ABC transporter permease [Synechococcales bacterium]